MALHDDVTVGFVEQVLAELPAQPTVPPPLFAPPSITATALRTLHGRPALLAVAIGAAVLVAGLALRRG